MRFPMFLFGLFLVHLLVASGEALWAQSTDDSLQTASSDFGFDQWRQTLADYHIEPFAMLQLWGVYTMDQRVAQTNAEGEVITDAKGAPVLEPVEDRLDLTFRRARLGFRAEPYRRLKTYLALFYDHVGRDGLGASMGGYNNPPVNLGVWDAFVQYRFLPASQGLNLVAGYFRPQLGRESITSAWSVNSFEKAMSQTYLRRHLVGTGSGRAMGLNLGGTFPGEGLGFNYNLGLFTPQTTSEAYPGLSAGRLFAPLWVGRAVVYLGEPEQERYQIGYKINHFGQRNGLSLGLGASFQGETELFETSSTLAADLLWNAGPVTVDGEYMLMARSDDRIARTGGRDIDYRSNTGHGRAGYSFVLGNQFLEVTAMLMWFDGADQGSRTDDDALLSSEEQQEAALVGAFSGDEYTYDIGLNWYLDRRALKLMVHYTIRDSPERGRNDYWRQSGVGVIQRGDWLGAGFHAIF